MRSALIALILLLPSALSAGPTMGIFFDNPPTLLYKTPAPYEQFRAYVVGEGINCFLDAAEFSMTVPAGLVIMAYTVPQGSLTLGFPASGISITYWPPMDGWNPGYNLLCTLDFFYVGNQCWCPYGGTAMDLVLRIVPHPDSHGILGSCWPENNLFNFTGLYSVACPSLLCMGTEESSWGAIKSLYR